MKGLPPANLLALFHEQFARFNAVTVWIRQCLLWALLVGLSQSSWGRPAMGGGAGEDGDGPVVTDQHRLAWQKWNGVVVADIQFQGLIRTKRQAVLWLMHTQIGRPFAEDEFAHDLQTLYNTGNLYDLKGEVEQGPTGLVVTVQLHDKWTLFPAFGAQGGGGSSTVGGGIFETNLLGYMVNASFFTWSFNGTNSFDLNFNQEYVAGTDTMWSFDLQDSIEAQSPHFSNGQSAGNFAWRRVQKEVMLGTHLEGPWRLMFYGSVFQDTIFNNEGGFNVNTPAGLQNKFYPKFIFGKVDWSNYLEHGFELTVQPSFANILGPAAFYSGLELDYKRVWISGAKDQDNVALYLSGVTLSNGAPNYQLQVGGYYNLRGYADMREVGHSLVVANLEYRPYLARHRWELLDLDLMVIQGCLFSDVGSAWADSTLTGETQAQYFRPLWSVGTGLRINMVKFAGAIVRLDLAQTLIPNEGLGFSFGIGQFF